MAKKTGLQAAGSNRAMRKQGEQVRLGFSAFEARQRAPPALSPVADPSITCCRVSQRITEDDLFRRGPLLGPKRP